MSLSRGSVAEMVAATPKSRDRYVDFMRAFSIGVVVFGHWLMAVVYFDEGRLSGANLLDVVPWAWAGTWFLQVMPLFFFVGGFSNFTSWRAHQRKSGSLFDFVSGRVDRLMRPTLVFIGVWLGVSLVVELAAPGSSSSPLGPALDVIARPLWFVAVYLIVVAFAPGMVALHTRYGYRVPVALVVCVAIVDVLRIAMGVPVIGWLNFAFVWLFAHQLGFYYADGTLLRWSRRRIATVAAAAFGIMALLTAFGPYSLSMVGMSDGRVSNSDPPSLAMVALTVWLVGGAMFLRRRISVILEGNRLWGAVIAANSVIMTTFLWHLTALLLAVLLLYPLGWPQPGGGTVAWWLLRPVWMVVVIVFLIPIVGALSRFERPRATRVEYLNRPALVAVIGSAALTLGMAGLATEGFEGVLASARAGLNVVFIAAGTLLFRKGHHPRSGRSANHY
jgi:fucose 4-O-acetylase-like acetyltransferase